MKINLQQLPLDLMVCIASYLKPIRSCCIDLGDYIDLDDDISLLGGNRDTFSIVRPAIQRYGFEERGKDEGLLNFATASRYLHAAARICTVSKNWSVAQAIVERGYPKKFATSLYQPVRRPFAPWIVEIPRLRGDHLQLSCVYDGVEPTSTGGNLTESDIRFIEEFLQNNDTDTDSLVIKNLKMHTSMERIANALRNNTTVSELIFPQNCISSKGAILLAESLSLQENSAIKEIDLSNPYARENRFMLATWSQATVRINQFNRIGDAGAAALVHAVIAKPKFKVLDLRGNHLISADCATHLTARMQAAGKTLLV